MNTFRQIHDYVKVRAEQSPHNLAVSDKHTQISYKTLDHLSDQFSALLKQKGVAKGDLIVLNVRHKSTDLIISILGILKCGATFVPISASLPKILHQDLLNSISPKAIVSDKACANCIPFQSLHVQFTASPTQHQACIAHDIAYIMYTSGTTGKPKGIPIAHDSLIDTYKSWSNVYELSTKDRHLQMADSSFDVFTGDWIRALCSGASLFLYPKEELLHPEALFRFINTHKITIGEFVPAVIKRLTQYALVNQSKLSSFRLLICGSDTWTINECQQTISICPETTKIVNSYGLTETTIDSTYFDCRNLKKYTHLQSTDSVPIGQAFPHVQALVLNAQYKPAAQYESGELYIGGSGLSPIGYLDNEKLTEDRFVNLERNNCQQRFYRTGDKAMILSTGDILFCGRNDLQTNIHGKRVDVVTTEAIIKRFPGIEQCVVVPVKKGGRNTLHAFIVSNETVYKSTLISYLKERLPRHYIPQQFHTTHYIPLNRNGKINRDYQQFQSTPLPNEFIPPSTPLERAIANIWHKYIPHTADISINTPFVCLQKETLHFARMISELNKRYNIKLKPRLALSTIQSLCKEIKCQHDQIITRAPRSSIALIGGGPGAIALCHSLVNELITRKEKHVEITIYEKSETIGHGIPYQHQQEDAYILNLPTNMMALGNNTDQDFHAWYQQHYGDLYSSEFPPRHIFGEYVANIAQELITVAKGHHIQIKYMTNTEIIKVKKRPSEQEYCLIGEQEYFTSNFIVFCTGHMSSANYRELIGASGYRHNAWAKHIRRKIQKSHNIGILGTRISAIDLVMKLKASNQTGKIKLFSRSGLLPSVLAKKITPIPLQQSYLKKIEAMRGKHGKLPLEHLVDFILDEISIAQGKSIQFDTILSSHKQIQAQDWLEKEIRSAEANNKPWQQILLSFYPLIPKVWTYLTVKDKQIFLQKYHTLFLTYLAGIPLENAKKMHALIQSGEVEIHGGLTSVSHKNEHFAITTTEETFITPHLFNATGPGYNTNIYPIFQDLARTGLSKAHPCGGLRVDPETQSLLDIKNRKTHGLFAMGELTRGEFWATTDMGQINAQCQKIAPGIIDSLQKYQRKKGATTLTKSTQAPSKISRRKHEIRQK